MNDFQKFPKACNNTYDFSVKVRKDVRRREGLIIDISFTSDPKVIRILRKVTQWTKVFRITFDGLEEGKDYKKEIKMENKKLMLLGEFFNDQKETKLTIESISHYIDKDGNVPDNVARLL